MINHNHMVQHLTALLLMAVLMVMPIEARAQSPGPQFAAPWFTQVLARFASIPERREMFHEEKQFSALNQPLCSQGQLLYRHPAFLRKITITPKREDLSIDGDQLTLTESDGIVHVLSLSSHPEIAMLVDAVGGILSGDLSRIERAYRTVVTGDQQSWQLVLLPTNPAIRKMLQQIVVRGRDTVIDSMMTSLTGGDSQILVIDHQQAAATLACTRAGGQPSDAEHVQADTTRTRFEREP